MTNDTDGRNAYEPQERTTPEVLAAIPAKARLMRAISILRVRSERTQGRPIDAMTSGDLADEMLEALGEPERLFTLDGEAVLVWRVNGTAKL